MITAKADWTKHLPPLSNSARLTLSEQIYQTLIEAILQGRLGPGEHLVEQALADRFGISRIAVREAIRRLHADGLVEVIPNRGVFTIELSSQDTYEIYELRAMLESTAIRLVTERARRSDLALLEEALDDMRAVESTEDRVAATTADMAFHRRLVELAGYPRLDRFWRSMNAQIMMIIYNSSSYYPNIGNLAERHARILAAMRTGNPDAAVSAITHHIRDGGRHLLDALAQDRAQAR